MVNHHTKQQTFILIHPPQNNLQNLANFTSQQTSFSKVLAKHTEQTFINQLPKDQFLSNQSNFEPSCQHDQSFIESQVGQKKRKNKNQKMKQIEQKHLDDGRGGNCVASNICKTLLRIVMYALTGQILQELKYYIKKYKIRSQKQNSVLIILLLHILIKQGKITLITYEKMFDDFIKSLRDSQHNCERKMKDQGSRRGFHLKNKKMYHLFAEINIEIYNRSKNNITKNQVWDIKSLQEIVSNTYDRKQRQVQKAMNKIKSIIMIHSELKELFNNYEINIQESFFEAIEYAYRRNLPKRCKHIKQRALKIMDYFKSHIQIRSQEDKFMVCLMVLKLVKQKQQQIWVQFVMNLYMKQQYTKSVQDRKRFKQYLQNEIPSRFDNLIKMKQQRSKEQNLINKQNSNQIMSQIVNNKNSECKIQDQTIIYEQKQQQHQYKLLSIYKQLKFSSQF